MKSDFEQSWMSEEAGRSNASVVFFDPSTVLYVSLFLILFAFFAALNTRAEESSPIASDVLSSLGQSFGGGNVVAVREGMSPRHSGESGQGDVLAEATALLQETFAGSGAHRVGNRLEAELSLDGFFIGRQAKLAPSRELFLKRLVDVLVATEGNRVQLVLSSSSSAVDNASVQRRLALLAMTAEKYGLEARAVRIATHQGRYGDLQLAVEVQ